MLSTKRSPTLPRSGYWCIKCFFFLSQHSKKETRENVIDHLSNMQSSIALAGVQWNMPVESYFISVFSKSKSLAWSSAMPTSKPLPPPFAFSTLALFVGLKQKYRGERVQRTIRYRIHEFTERQRPSILSYRYQNYDTIVQKYRIGIVPVSKFCI